MSVSVTAEHWIPIPKPVTAPALALALLAGAVHATSLAWPFSWQTPYLTWLGLRAGQPVWWLQLLALTLLACLLKGGPADQQQRSDSPDWRRGALWGWLFGSAWLAGSFGWLFVSMHTYGGLHAVLAGLAVLVLATLLALFYAGACGLFIAITPVNRALSAIIFAALWLSAELARGCWLSGFGWGASGYAHVDGPLASYAAWIGVYGLCALAAWLAMCLQQLLHELTRCQWSDWRRYAWVRLALSLSGVLVVLLVPALIRSESPEDAMNSTGRLRVTLLQGNIPQDEKFEPGTGVPLALQWYAEQLKQSRTSLVIAPETAIPVLPEQLPPGYWQDLQHHFSLGGQAALIGSPVGNERVGYTNSVLGFKPGQQRAWRYDKRHLVPFGEFIPTFFKWFTDLMNIPLGDFKRGASRQTTFDWQGQRLATNICYEDLFGEELAPAFLDPALSPTLFVNISNLAWFGNGLALDQHLQISRMRAREFGRAFVLATNTGVSAIVDHRGQVIASLPRETRTVLVTEVEGRSGTTPYAWWVARLGLWPLWLLALGAALVALRARFV